MVGNLDDLDELAVRAGAADRHAGLLELPAILRVELVAVAMALRDLAACRSACRGCQASGQHAGLCAEPHRAALVGDPSAALRACRSRGAACRRRTRCCWRPCRPSTLRANSITAALHAEADAEVRNLALAGVAGSP